MGQVYSVSRSNIALSTTTDILTITAATGRSLRIKEINIGGMGTASAANELGVYRPGTLGVTPVALTAEKTNPNQVAPSFTAASGWTTQPVVTATAPIIRVPVNSNGGVYRWVSTPNTEIEVPGGAQLSFRSVIGTGLMTITVLVEEF